MIPSNFQYKRPATVSEALSLLQQDSNAKLLAGGHSLIPALKLRLNQPSTLIHITRLAELKFIKESGNIISIGAATTHGAIADSKIIQSKLPLLAEAAHLIGDMQVRNVGTIGGSIAHADPASDWPAVLIAANATIHVKSAKGQSNVAVGDFFKGFFSTALSDGEIISEITIPVPGNKTTAYEKFVQPASRFAMAACAVQLKMDGATCSEASIAFNGVSDAAYRATSVEKALKGKKLDYVTIAAASSLACEQASMILSDQYASEAYRRHLAQVVCKRALLRARK